MKVDVSHLDHDAALADKSEYKEMEFRFTDRDFKYLRELVSRETGIVITESKRQMIYSRLSRRLRSLNLRDFRDYCLIVEEDIDGELNSFINAITTNLTSFFREPHHFDYLKDVVVPGLLEKNASTRRIRVWSAGCSTGEEPYSIAMTMAEALPPESGWDWRILATDIDTEVLAKAEQGIYPQERAAAFGQSLLKRWFRRGNGENQGMIQVAPELRKQVTFRKQNLMEEWPVRGPIDVLFCRNVVIYFDKDTQRRIFAKFAALMEQGACLFIGHSESLYKVSEHFELLGQTIYRKKT